MHEQTVIRSSYRQATQDIDPTHLKLPLIQIANYFTQYYQLLYFFFSQICTAKMQCPNVYHMLMIGVIYYYLLGMDNFHKEFQKIHYELASVDSPMGCNIQQLRMCHIHVVRGKKLTISHFMFSAMAYQSKALDSSIRF